MSPATGSRAFLKDNITLNLRNTTMLQPKLVKEADTFNDARASYRVGRSKFYVDVYSSRSFAIRNESTGQSVNGICYDTGAIAYDMPEWLPLDLLYTLRQEIPDVLR